MSRITNKLHEKTNKDDNCSCKDKEKCPLKNRCKVEKGIVYEATVTRFSIENKPENVRKYIGGTSLTFKKATVHEENKPENVMR